MENTLQNVSFADVFLFTDKKKMFVNIKKKKLLSKSYL